MLKNNNKIKNIFNLTTTAKPYNIQKGMYDQLFNNARAHTSNRTLKIKYKLTVWFRTCFEHKTHTQTASLILV